LQLASTNQAGSSIEHIYEYRSIARCRPVCTVG
jgi:hypothetical protein